MSCFVANATLKFAILHPTPRITGTLYSALQHLSVLKFFIAQSSKTPFTFNGKIMLLNVTLNTTQSWSTFKPMSAVHYSHLNSNAIYVKARHDTF